MENKDFESFYNLKKMKGGPPLDKALQIFLKITS